MLLMSLPMALTTELHAMQRVYPFAQRLEYKYLASFSKLWSKESPDRMKRGSIKNINELTEETKNLHIALCTGQTCKYIIVPTPKRFEIDSIEPRLLKVLTNHQPTLRHAKQRERQYNVLL